LQPAGAKQRPVAFFGPPRYNVADLAWQDFPMTAQRRTETENPGGLPLRKRVAMLKARFERHFGQGRLSGGQDDALTVLEEIERLMPGDPFCAEGRHRIAEVYSRQAEDKQAQGLRGEAQHLFGLAAAILPDGDAGPGVAGSAESVVGALRHWREDSLHGASRDQVVAKQREAAESLGVEPVFSDSIDGDAGPEMAVIPAGSFFMGSPVDEYAHEACEEPLHKVGFSRPFAMARFAVTHRWFARFCADTGHPLPQPYGRWTQGDMPAINVTWNEACAFARWVSEKTGALYRLPTEAEWEYASRAGTTTAFAFGDKIHRHEVNCSGGLHCTRGLFLCGLGRPVPVGSLPANRWGLCEMHGNVQEFVQDHWRENYAGTPCEGSLAYAGGDTDRRVVRGGSWFDSPGTARSAARRSRQLGEFDLNLGFRLVKEF